MLTFILVVILCAFLIAKTRESKAARKAYKVRNSRSKRRMRERNSGYHVIFMVLGILIFLSLL